VIPFAIPRFARMTLHHHALSVDPACRSSMWMQLALAERSFLPAPKFSYRPFRSEHQQNGFGGLTSVMKKHRGVEVPSRVVMLAHQLCPRFRRADLRRFVPNFWRERQSAYTIARSAGLAGTMSRYLIRRIEETPTIVLRPNTEIVALEGGDYLESESSVQQLGYLECLLRECLPPGQL